MGWVVGSWRWGLSLGRALPSLPASSERNLLGNHPTWGQPESPSAAAGPSLSVQYRTSERRSLKLHLFLRRAYFNHTAIKSTSKMTIIL